jgi:trehalose-phosphatase
VEKHVRAGGKLLLLLDFDGTLAPIVVRPERATLPVPTGKVLRRLARRPGFVVGIVTGRSLADIRRRARIAGAWYVGSHGLEYALPGGCAVRLVDRPCRHSLRQLRKQLGQELPRVAGLRLEAKPYSLAVHYRRVVREHLPRILRVVRGVASMFVPAFRLQRGKEVVEFLPNIPADKGRTVCAVIARLVTKCGRDLTPIYFGDDVTDEAVFRLLRQEGWTVRVGSLRGRTRARYYLRSPAEVRRWLEWLAEVTQ